MAERGFGKGDVLAVYMPNLPEYAVAFHGAASAGGMCMTVNPQGGCRGELRLIEQYDRVLVFKESPSGRGASRCIFYDRLEIVPWGKDLVIRGNTVAPKTRFDGVLHTVSGG